MTFTYSAHRLHRTQRNYLLLLDLKNASPETLVGSLSPRQVEESIQTGVREALRLNRRKDDLTLRSVPARLRSRRAILAGWLKSCWIMPSSFRGGDSGPFRVERRRPAWWFPTKAGA